VVSRGVTIGIIAAVIVAGAAIGYAFFQRSVPDSNIQTPSQPENEQSAPGNTTDALAYTSQPIPIDAQKGYAVVQIGDGIYWLVGSGYQTMFLTTGQGVIAVDAPQPLGEKYIQAIEETTDEPITHMIYSHHHQDHVGAAGQIFSDEITYIAHRESADVLANASDPNRPVPSITFEDEYTLAVGNQTLELYHIGNYHSNGDIVIYSPDQKVAMAVDLLRPGITPFRAFAVTPDIDQYLEAHDTLAEDFDFNVLVSGHTQLLATKDHIATNKQFTLDVMENAREALQSSDADAARACADRTIEEWQGRLGSLDEFMIDHCTAMIDYLSE
jgi:glyoxylase-like metal-dependent hydrolase (beta-lactamase superfamily II)